MRFAENHHLLMAQYHFDIESFEQELAEVDPEMNSGGDYQLLGVYRSGEVTIRVEQNTDTRSERGVTLTTAHPEVAVLTGPGGTAACSAADLELIAILVSELS